MPPTIRLTFHGAVGGQVTGSMHLVEAAGARVLLDSGLFQGRRSETHQRNVDLPLDPRRIDSVVISHAHIDHTGRLPLLVSRGFHGPMYATPATRDLLAPLLLDAAHIQEKDHETLVRHERASRDSEPLYTRRDAIRVHELTHGIPYRRPYHLRKFMTFEFLDAGHILGSSSVDLRVMEGAGHRLVFSGDIGRSGLPIIRDPEVPGGKVDSLIIESTYANRDHGTPQDAKARLAEVIGRVAGRGGKVLIPAFALGRVQELVYDLHALWREKRLPEVPVFIDSPLAVDLTEVFRLHPDIFDMGEAMARSAARLFDFPLVKYVREAADSKRLNSLPGPAVIIAASGMMESGRILHHLANHAGDHRNCILVVGFQAEHTLGRRVVEGATRLKIFGEEIERRAEVEVINGYSAHADRTELRAWVRALGGPVQRAFVVHGEDPQRQAMAAILKEEGVREVHLPAQGESFEA